RPEDVDPPGRRRPRRRGGDRIGPGLAVPGAAVRPAGPLEPPEPLLGGGPLALAAPPRRRGGRRRGGRRPGAARVVAVPALLPGPARGRRRDLDRRGRGRARAPAGRRRA